jgi:putative ABC transport system substrate-binding protein
MKRREFITLLGGAAVAWPLAARAQQSERVRRIGYLANLSPASVPELMSALREGLRERGYVQGQNLTFEYRWAAEMNETLAAELVALNVDVIIAWATPAVTAARRATSKIPIVMVGIADPIGAGLVANLSRPGGNVTGTTNLARDLGGKLLELLLEIVPRVNPVFVLRNPRNPASPLQLREVEGAARSLGLRITLIDVTSPGELDAAFGRMIGENAKGVIALADPLLISQSVQLAALAQNARLPLIFSRRENVEAGGLISYGPSLRGQFRDTAMYIDKIFKGADPANLPVEQPTRLELVVNLKTAMALNLTVPPTLLARADEVIE